MAMTGPNIENNVDTATSRDIFLKDLTKKKLRSERYRRAAVWVAMIAATIGFVIAGGIESVLTNPYPATNRYDLFFVFSPIFVGLVITVVFLAKRSANNTTPGQFLVGRAYDTYKAVQLFQSTKFQDKEKNIYGENERRIAIQKATDLVNEVKGWKTNTTPAFMAKPADDLIAAIDSVVIEKIKEPDPRYFGNIENTLKNLVVALENDPSGTKLKDVITDLNQIPHLERKPETSVPLLKKHGYIKSFVIGVLAGVVAYAIVSASSAPQYAAVSVAIPTTVGVAAFVDRRVTK